MPFFYFKSGMFAKDNVNYMDSLKNGYYKLLVPYFIFTLVGYIIDTPFSLFSDDTSLLEKIIRPWLSLIRHGSMAQSLPLWFLLSLFEVKIAYVFLRHLLNARITYIPYSLITLFVLLAAGYFISYCFKMLPLMNPLGVFSIFSGLFFYMTGYYYRKFPVNNMYLVVISSLVFISIYGLVECNVEMRYNTCSNAYFLWHFKCLAGIILIISIFKKFYFFSMLQYIGRNSITFYICHWFVLLLTKHTLLIFYPNYTANQFIIIALASCIVLLPFIDVFLRYNCPMVLGLKK